MDDQDNAASPMSTLSRLGIVLLLTLTLGSFAIVSWYGIESFLNAHAGECLGPICLGPP